MFGADEQDPRSIGSWGNGFDEQIFGVNEQILGRDQTD
jgi:hypothetical protein